MHIELIVAKLVVIVLGLLIAREAYRGYRRYDDRPMLFVAVGFVFVAFGGVLEGVLFDVVGLSIFLAGTIQTLVVAVGFLCVLYSLHGLREA